MAIKLALNTSVKYHRIIAVFLGLWLTVFLVFIAPFDAQDLSFEIRLAIMPVYGLICIIGYFCIIPFQKKLYARSQSWSVIKELGTVSVFILIVWILSFLYYKSSIVNGDFTLINFSLYIFAPITLLLSSFAFFTRYLLTLLRPKENARADDNIVILGQSKLDVLQVKPDDLLAISSAGNYVEVHYLKQGINQSKLLRCTLKEAHEQVPDLLRIHRSHLVNQSNVIDWKDSNTLSLPGMELAVSKKYKSEVTLGIHSSQADGISSQ